MNEYHEELFEKVPEHVREGLLRYVEHHIATGHFLRAVLENNLKEAFSRADLTNQREMFHIVNWLYNCAPGACWGSPEKVEKWLAAKAESQRKG